MQCRLCGECNSDENTFCANCGRFLDAEHSSPHQVNEKETFPTDANSPGIEDLSSAEVSAGETGIGDRPPAPYARFVICFLASACLSSSAAFLIFYSLPFGEPRKLSLAVFLAAASLLTTAFARRLWSAITKIEPPQAWEFVERHRSVLRASIIMLLLAWSIASFLGHMVGDSGFAMEKLLLHAQRSRELTSSIAEERNESDPTIPAMVQTLESLQPKAEELQSVLSLLKEDWKDYQRRFPVQSFPQRRLAQVDVLIKQNTLLLQEIKLAKEIEPLHDEQQEAQWTDKVIPLEQAEEALAKGLPEEEKSANTKDDRQGAMRSGADSG